MTEKLSHSLWHSLLHWYGLLGVKELCLRLQNEADMDVVLVLASVYWQRNSKGCPKAEALEEYLQWREQIIVPLRGVRLRLNKEQQPELRQQLLASELKAEQHGVRLLAALTEQEFNQQAMLLNQPYAFLNGEVTPQAQPLFQRLLALLGDSLVNPID